MTIGKYILKGHVAVPVHDLIDWAKIMECVSRKVAHTMLGSILISTVFLGLDHSHNANGPPLLFETMVFGGKMDQDMYRYTTWAQAERGHARMVAKVKDRGLPWYHYIFRKRGINNV